MRSNRAIHFVAMLASAVLFGVCLMYVVSVFISIYRPLRVTDPSPSPDAVAFTSKTTSQHKWFMPPPKVRHVTSKIGRTASVVQGGIADDYYESNGAQYYPGHEFGLIKAGFPFQSFSGQVHRRDNKVADSSFAIVVEDNMITHAAIIPLKPELKPFLLNLVIYTLLALACIRTIRTLYNRRQLASGGWQRQNEVIPRNESL